MNEIHLIKNNDKRIATDLEWVDTLYDHLQNGSLKLSPAKAFQVIYLLQEHVCVFPDHIDQCFNCKELFDSNYGGYYTELMGGRNYCAICIDYAPRKIKKDVGYI